MNGLVRILQAHHRSCFVHYINGLIRQASVCNISFRHSYARLNRLISIYYIVIFLIVDLGTVQDGNRVGDICALHNDFLETSVQSPVLLHIFSELVHCSRSDALDLAAGKCRLQHVRRIQAA